SASNVGSWVHWALVRSGSTLALYRNGIQVASRGDLPASAQASLSGAIGRQAASYPTSHPAKAAIDDVAVYNAALSGATARSHYRVGSGDTTPPGAPTGLEAAAGSGSVTLDWADNSEPELAGYDVYRSTASGGPYTKI